MIQSLLLILHSLMAGDWREEGAERRGGGMGRKGKTRVSRGREREKEEGFSFGS